MSLRVPLSGPHLWGSPWRELAGSVFITATVPTERWGAK